MNDAELREFGVLAISEPYARTIDNTVVTVPLGHANWTKMVPSEHHQGRWAFRSMLWIRKDIEAEQISVQSSDLTAAMLRLPDRPVLVVSVYVEGQSAEALMEATSRLHRLIARDRRERKRMVNLEYTLQLRAGIDARRAERVRKRELLEFQRSNPDTELPRELLQVIIDPYIERRRREEEEEEEEQLRRQLAAEESGFVDFADLDYDMIHSASDSVSDNESLPDIIDPNLSN